MGAASTSHSIWQDSFVPKKGKKKKNGNNYTRGEKSPFAIKKNKKKFPIDIKGRPVRGGLI